MKQYNIVEAKSHFSELVKRALMGEEIVIVLDNKPILKLTQAAEAGKARQPGSARGQILSTAPDFDDALADFREYV